MLKNGRMACPSATTRCQFGLFRWLSDVVCLCVCDGVQGCFFFWGGRGEGKGKVDGGLGVVEVRDPDIDGLPVSQRQQDISLGLFRWLSEVGRVCVCVCGWGLVEGGGGN